MWRYVVDDKRLCYSVDIQLLGLRNMRLFTIKKTTVIESYAGAGGAKIYCVLVSNQLGESKECGVQIDNDTITGVLPDLSNTSLHLVSVAKKRTLQASIKALVKSHPAVLSEPDNGRDAYRYFLRKDYEQKQRKVRLKRKWKVHHLAMWENGFFLARLSCNKHDQTSFEYTQIILYPKFTLDGYFQIQLELSTTHGSLRTQIKLEADLLRISLASQRHWPQLSELLKDVTQGYHTEIEAKAGF